MRTNFSVKRRRFVASVVQLLQLIDDESISNCRIQYVAAQHECSSSGPLMFYTGVEFRLRCESPLVLRSAAELPGAMFNTAFIWNL